MNKDIDANPLVSPEERMVQFVAKTVAIVVTIIIVSMVGCTMHGNMYEADVKAQEVLIEAEKTKQNAATAQSRVEETKSRERMIEKGANPIAVRCMEEGWRSDDGVCMAVGVSGNKINVEDFE